jgi:RecA/RadA recombinase
MSETDDIKRELTGSKGGSSLPYARGLSTGSTLLNLACTGRPRVGLLPGHYYLLVGDSSAGKTMISRTMLAEASINKHFNDHRLIFDDVENGSLMECEKFFGKRMAQRLEPPSGSKKDPLYSTTVEDFYYHVDDALRAKQPFIYVMDSMDALVPRDDEEKFDKGRKKALKGKEDSGSYGTAKAKLNSQNLRLVFSRLRSDGRSILIVLSQTRENIGFGAQFNPKTRAGGKALTFYAALEIWTSVAGHLKNKEREVGIICKARVKKNRFMGQDRTVEFPILHRSSSPGIDDVGGMIAYMVGEGRWKGSDRMVEAPEFEHSGSREKLVEKVQEGNLEWKLQALVAQTWKDVEQGCELKRKGRYG